MARGNFWPFVVIFCCGTSILHANYQTVQAEPYRSSGRTSLSLVRPVAYVEAESISDPAIPSDALSKSAALETDAASHSSETLPFFAPLLAQLEEVSQLGNSQAQSWAAEAIASVRDLARAAHGSQDEVRVACDRLDRNVREAYMLASMRMSNKNANQLRRTGYAIQRRLSICRILLPIERQDGTAGVSNPTGTGPNSPPDPQRLEKAVRAVETLLASDPAGKTWREFLMLDDLANLPALSDRDTDPRLKDPGGVTQRRTVVRKALSTASDTWLNEQQQSFLLSPELKELGAALRAEATGPITREKILELIEQYEALGLPSTGKQLADETMWLSLVNNQERFALRQELTNHYRNANLRIEVAEVLMDRFIPPRTAELAPVRDTVLGNQVRGESLTETKVRIQLLPSEERLTLAIDITGEVDASTFSKSGPATFRNRSVSWYHAQKPLEITTAGLKIMPAEILEVRNSTRLRSLRTSLDGIPLIGSLVKDVARSQHDSKQSEMRKEIRRKVSSRAKNKFETEANEQLGKLAKRFEEKVLEPLDRLSLGPTLVQARTTDDRLVMRVRLASVRQLGAHTMRPKAPSDALLSFQVHESALNNAIEQLKINGRTFKVLEIRQKLAKLLKRPDLADTPNKHDDATITLAAEDAIRMKIEDGRLRINLAVAELRKGSQAWHNFEVSVFYSAINEKGLATYLARDGVVRLNAGRVSFRSQVVLRSVFCVVFSKNRTLPILPPKVVENPRMADLYLSQLSLDSGWLAVALSSHKKSIAQQPEANGLR